jgi:rhodanese-related sulfurtransferase
MKSSIHPQSTMTEVLAVFPGAQRALFRHYHIGGCASCAFQPEETLEALSARHNLKTADVIQQIETSHQQDLALEISPAELAERIQARDVHLVDVRSREEFEATHIESAVLLSQPVMQDILAKWSRTDLLVLYDHRGQRSLDAAAYFIGQGFGNVRGLRGGIDAWSREVDAKIPRYRLEMTT